MILQRYQNLLDSVAEYFIVDSKGDYPSLHGLKSNLMSLIMLIRTPLIKGLSGDKDSPYKSFIALKDSIMRGDDDEVFVAIEYVESFLYSKGVTKWDTKKIVDVTNMFETNSEILS
jgi:hypothetical protein